MSTPWRDPAEESLGLYPGLVVDDGRQSGSITVGRSRLPLWSFIGTALHFGWDEVEAGWSPTEHYGFTEDDLSGFLHHLLNVRGEFGRLLLVLANAERLEDDRSDRALDGHGPVVNVTPGDPSAVQLPPSWWEDDVLAIPVIRALTACLDALGLPSTAPEMLPGSRP